MNRISQEWQHIRSNSLAHNAGWMFIGQGLSVACQGTYFILLARLLGSREFGLYVGVLAMVSILSQYSALGSQTVLLGRVSQNPKTFPVYWGNVLATAFVLGGVLSGLLAWIGPHVAYAYSWKMVLCVAAGDCVCLQLTQAVGRVFQAFEEMRISAAINLLTNLLRVLVAGSILITLRSARASQWALAALGISFLGTCMGLALVTHMHGRPVFSPRLLRQRLAEGIVFALSYSTSGICDNIDKTMLGHYSMNVANGIYTMAYRAIDAATIPLSAVQSAVVPRLFRKGAAGTQSTAAYAVRIVKRTGPLTFVVALILWLAAPLIPYFVGRGFSESVAALRWLCLLPLFRSFNLSAGDALTGAGHIRLRLGGLVTAAVFNFTTNLYLIPHYEWLGAAWASLATDGLLAVFNWTVLMWLTSKAESMNPRISEIAC
jgi:O-antigen/teichoic acid export membrane protein